MKLMRCFLPCWVALAAWIVTGFGVGQSVAAENKGKPFAKEIAAFVSRDATNPPPKGAVLFVGSSTIRMWPDVAADFPELKTINRGFGGSQMSDLNGYMDQIVVPYAPSKIILYEGDNDIAAGKSPERVAADFKTFVDRTHTALPNTEIYFLAIKPSPSREKFQAKGDRANDLVKAFAKETGKVHFIDVNTPLLMANGKPDPKFFKPDMLHKNPSGYALWVPIIRKAIEQKDGK